MPSFVVRCQSSKHLAPPFPQRTASVFREVFQSGAREAIPFGKGRPLRREGEVLSDNT